MPPEIAEKKQQQKGKQKVKLFFDRQRPSVQQRKFLGALTEVAPAEHRETHIRQKRPGRGQRSRVENVFVRYQQKGGDEQRRQGDHDIGRQDALDAARVKLG